MALHTLYTEHNHANTPLTCRLFNACWNSVFGHLFCRVHYHQSHSIRLMSTIWWSSTRLGSAIWVGVPGQRRRRLPFIVQSHCAPFCGVVLQVVVDCVGTRNGNGGRMSSPLVAIRCQAEGQLVLSPSTVWHQHTIVIVLPVGLGCSIRGATQISTEIGAHVFTSCEIFGRHRCGHFPVPW